MKIMKLRKEETNMENKMFEVEQLKAKMKECKDTIQIQLQKPDTSKNLVGRPFLDMQITYAIPVETINVGIQTDLLKEFDWTEEELYQIAIKNMQNEAQLNKLINILMGKNVNYLQDHHERIDILTANQQPELFMLSNQSRKDGAGVILNQELLTNIQSKFQTDFYVLPSSIHEVLLMPICADLNYDQPSVDRLKKMVIEVNTEQVSPQEQLSDSVYIFTNGELKIA